jgi:hypothetical protein
MKINHFLTLALAATTLFASCSKEIGNNDNLPVDNGERRAVMISVNRDGGTRAIGNPVGATRNVTFNDGYLVFTNDPGNIEMVIAIIPGAGAFNGTSVGVEDLDSAEGGGEWITGVPAVSTKVYFIGNYDGTAPAVNSDIDDITDNVAEQYDGGGVDEVVLFGAGSMEKATGTGPTGDPVTDEDYTATFDVAPIAARYEIGAITGAHTEGKTFTYTVKGIFIDRYYDMMPLNGAADNNQVKYNRNIAANYVTGAGSYLAGMSDIVFNYDGTTGVASNVNTTPAQVTTTPDYPEVWAYNMLAPKTATPSTDFQSLVMPTIIIKLDDIMVDGTAWPGPLFLTVQTFNGPSGAISSLGQGKVYTIADIPFNEDDLTPEPYIKTKNVLVTINMLQWESIPVTVEL